MRNQATHIGAARANLRQLSYIRYIAIGAQAITLIVFGQVYPLGLPIPILSAMVVVFLLVAIATHWRTYLPRTISNGEFFSHLLMDIFALSAVVYFSGGASNPFISYYLVPISIAAITLPGAMTWAVTLVSLTAYSLLVFFYHAIGGLDPHSAHTGGTGNSGNLHILGMWINFGLSAGLITYFVIRMAETLRQQEAELSAQKEEQMQDEQLLAIATQAASAAHELGTPLNTMKLLIDELKTTALAPDQRQDLSTLDKQIQRCHRTLQSLVRAAAFESQEPEVATVSNYIASLLDSWRLLRPDVNPSISIAENCPDIRARFHPVLRQSLQNLLNNAADASPDHVAVDISWDENTLDLEVRDRGPGITPEQAEKLGTPGPSKKPGGLGIGLFLSHNSLNRHGGQVRLTNAPQGGLITSVRLPLNQVGGP